MAARSVLPGVVFPAILAIAVPSTLPAAIVSDAFRVRPSFSPAGGGAMAGVGFGGILRCERDGLLVASRASAAPEKLTFIGTPGVAPEGEGALPGRASAFVGRDPSRWVRGAPRFESVLYRNLWPGIDLRVYGAYGAASGVEFDAIVHPGGRPERIAFDGGPSRAAIDAAGGVSFPKSGLVLRAPVVYQTFDGSRRAVSGRYRLARGGRLGFSVGPYDRRRDLTIDPTLAWSQYLGGNGEASGNPFDGAVGDASYNVARDGDGNTYVVGYTGSANFPTLDPISTVALGNEDAFVAKFDAAGTPQFISVVGGSGIDRFVGVAIGPDGSIVIAGYTDSPDLPTTDGVFAASYPNNPQSGNLSGFAVKLPPAGDSITWCTYVGGGNDDVTYRIAVDANGDPYLAGYTFQSSWGGQLRRFGSPGGLDGLVLELLSDASALVYVDAIGGDGQDLFNDLKLDSEGRAYVGGYSNSDDFPVTAGAYQTSCACNPAVAPNDQSGTFVRVSADGKTLEYASYLAHSETRVSALAIDGLGGMWLTGATTDRTFATVGNPAQGGFGPGTQDPFVVHVAHDGKSLLYATFLGSSTPDANTINITGGRGIATNPSASRIFVCGGIGPGPGTLPAVDPLPGGDRFAGGESDGFVAALQENGELFFSSYLGGTAEDLMYKVAADACGNVSVVGQTSSFDFPTAGATRTDYAGLNGFPNGTVSVLQFNDGSCDRIIVPVEPPGPGVVRPRP